MKKKIAFAVVLCLLLALVIPSFLMRPGEERPIAPVNVLDTSVDGEDGSSIGLDGKLERPWVRRAAYYLTRSSVVQEYVSTPRRHPVKVAQAPPSTPPDEGEAGGGEAVQEQGGSITILAALIRDISENFLGSAIAVSGGAEAYGDVTETVINSYSSAQASAFVGSAAGGEGNPDGSTTLTSNSEIDVDVQNTGVALANSGDAYAIGVLANNLINTNLWLNFAVQVLEENSSSNIAVNVVYNIVANLLGIANASSGDACAFGNQAQTNINSNSSAVSSLGGEEMGALDLEDDEGNCGDGDGCGSTTLTSNSEIDVDVQNTGVALANSGNASAIGVLANNLINTNLWLNFAVQVLEENSSSNIAVNVIYNIAANLLGIANANSGNAYAYGNQAQTSVNSNSSANSSLGECEGEMGTLDLEDDENDCEDDDGCDSGTTTLSSTSEIDVDVQNTGVALANSGNASAIGVLASNMINTNLWLNFAVQVLEENSSSNIAVNVIYNIAANLLGIANANSGNAYAYGNQAQTSVNSNSSANSSLGECEGEMGTLDLEDDENDCEDDDGCLPDDEGDNMLLTSDSRIGTRVRNTGRALAQSGNACAIGVLAEELIVTDLCVSFIVGLSEANGSSDLVVTIIYDIVADFFGIANASTGDTSAFGNLAETTIESNSRALTELGGCGGETTQTASTASLVETDVENDGLAVALSGDGMAVGIVAGCGACSDPEGCEDDVADSVDPETVNLSVASSGEASAVGNVTESEVDSTSVAMVSDGETETDGDACGEGNGGCGEVTAGNSTDEGDGNTLEFCSEGGCEDTTVENSSDLGGEDEMVIFTEDTVTTACSCPDENGTTAVSTTSEGEASCDVEGNCVSNSGESETTTEDTSITDVGSNPGSQSVGSEGQEGMNGTSNEGSEESDSGTNNEGHDQGSGESQSSGSGDSGSDSNSSGGRGGK